MDLKVQFESPENWIGKYQRNNKRNGLKNLRCFPFCGNPHKEKGFCGSSVRVRVRRGAKKANEPFFAWSEFCRVDDNVAMTIGTVITHDEILQKERDRARPTNPYYRGEIFDGTVTQVETKTESCGEDDDDEDDDDEEKAPKLSDWDNDEKRVADVVCFEFNKRRRGWNYSWTANKHTCNAMHALFVYVMVPQDTKSFKCVGVFSSPQFQVYCRKRPPRNKPGANSSSTSPLMDSPNSAGEVHDYPTPTHAETPFLPPTVSHDQSHRHHDDRMRPQSARVNRQIPGQQRTRHEQQPIEHHHPHQNLHHPHPHHQRQAPEYYYDDSHYTYGMDPEYESYPHAHNPYMSPTSVSSQYHYDYNQQGHQVVDPRQHHVPHYSYHRYYHTQPADVLMEPAQSQQLQQDDEESLFRAYFLDNFWNDEGSRINDFDAQTTRLKRARQASVIKQDSYRIGEQEQQQQHNMPSPPPLKELMKREEAHREDPTPPREADSVFGNTMDNEEQFINAKVWRLVLVLALVEAHWCEVQQVKRRQSLMNPGVAPTEWEPMWDLFDSFGGLDLPPPQYDQARSSSSSASTSVSGESASPDNLSIFPGDTHSSNSASNPSHNNALEEFLPKMDKDNRALVQSLANFLIEEKTFTRAIADTLSALPDGTPMKQMKTAFIRVAHEQLGTFCEAHDISLAQFDRLFEDQPPIEFLKQAAVRLQNLQETMGSYADLNKEGTIKAEAAATASVRDAKRERRTDVVASLSLPPLNCSGTYEMDQDLLDAHAFMREVRGVPWVLRKMIAYIEQRFEIIQHGFDRIHMQGNRKLLSNGVNVYITDGQKHPFTLQSPVPWSRPLAASYQSWFSMPKAELHLVHYYSDTERLERIITWGRYCLHFQLCFQTRNDASQDWETKHMRQGYANLVKQAEGFNADAFMKQLAQKNAMMSM